MQQARAKQLMMEAGTNNGVDHAGVEKEYGKNEGTGNKAKRQRVRGRMEMRKCRKRYLRIRWDKWENKVLAEEGQESGGIFVLGKQKEYIPKEVLEEIEGEGISREQVIKPLTEMKMVDECGEDVEMVME
jgi:hypothetical protein